MLFHARSLYEVVMSALVFKLRIIISFTKTYPLRNMSIITHVNFFGTKD